MDCSLERCRKHTSLDNDQVQNGDVLRHHAAADRLSTAFTFSTAVAAEALVAWGHEQSHTSIGQHTLLHGEALLVTPTHNLEYIALELLHI